MLGRTHHRWFEQIKVADEYFLSSFNMQFESSYKIQADGQENTMSA